MSTNNTYLNEYKKNQVETATPEQILILLYDGAIQYLNKAKIAIEQEDDETLHTNIFACEKIIIEFMNTLDMEKGGEVAQNLYRLYEYFYRTLVSAGISKSVEKIDEVLRHLKNLRDTWQKAIVIAKAEREGKLLDEVNKQSTTNPTAKSKDIKKTNEDEDEEDEEDDNYDKYESSSSEEDDYEDDDNQEGEDE